MSNVIFQSGKRPKAALGRRKGAIGAMRRIGMMGALGVTRRKRARPLSRDGPRAL
ncbi:MAG: hypothetical protein RSJ41_05455 [Clostridia bacterium]